jgi:hypothetical protein
MFQIGALSKAFGTVLICGLAYYITKYTSAPSRTKLRAVTCIVMLIPLLCGALSIIYKTSRLYCTFDGVILYNYSSRSTQRALLAYSFLIVFPIYICIIINSVLSVLLYWKITSLISRQTILLRENAEQIQLNSMVTRMQLYPIIIVMSWIPASVLFVLVNGFGIRHYALEIIAVLCLTLSGIGISLNYFYHQKSYPTCLKWCCTTPQDDSIGFLDNGIESNASWSETSGGSVVSGPTRGTFSAEKRSNASEPTLRLTRENTYSIARTLLPDMMSWAGSMVGSADDPRQRYSSTAPLHSS